MNDAVPGGQPAPAQLEAAAEPAVAPVAGVADPPTATIKAITFSDGTTLQFEPDEVVVFVGPNNAGKSKVLHDVQNSLNSEYRGTVASRFDLARTGTATQFEDYLRANTTVHPNGRFVQYKGQGYSIESQNLVNQFSRLLNQLGAFFVTALTTGNRLTGSDPVEGIDFYSDIPHNLIHTVFRDESV